MSELIAEFTPWWLNAMTHPGWVDYVEVLGSGQVYTEYTWGLYLAGWNGHDWHENGPGLSGSTL